MKTINQLKVKLKSGQSMFGAWSNIPSPSVINILSNTGMDFVVIDLEHGPVSYETLEYQIYAADCENVSPIVRLGSVEENAILHALEVGGQSIIVSHVKSADEVGTIVESAKYYPEGQRGISIFTRNHSYSAQNYEKKMEFINNQVFIGVLIEDEDGINNIEKNMSR